MTSLPEVPLSQGASDLLSRILPRIEDRLSEVDKTPVSILLWGPGINSSSPLASLRLKLRRKLREKGHAAVYSEEICDSSKSHSIRMQQLAQAQEFDLIVSTPCTSGSIGEIHDFVADHRVKSKILLFLNREEDDGYSSKSLVALSTITGCQVEYYSSSSETTIVEEVTYSTVRRIREMKYILAGRY